MEDVDDGALLRRVADGDEAAFDELWRRHAPWLLLRLRRRAPLDAADLVQETLVAAWRNAASFQGSDAGAWLWTIASRRLVDAKRRAAVGSRVLDARIQSVASTEDQALAGVLDPRLEAALVQLSPELAAALEATVIDGLSTREAALVLGVAEGTVKSRSSRARAFLRERLISRHQWVEEL